MSNFKYGHIQDPKDKPYIPFSKDQILKTAQPSNSTDVDLRPFSQARANQGQLGSCVAHGVLKSLQIKNAEKFGVENTVLLSRLSLYWAARSIMNPPQTHTDDGTNICLALDALRLYGTSREIMWPYDESKVFTIPSIMSSREEYLNKIDSHYKIDSTGNQRIDDIVLNLQNKNPVAFGMIVGDEFLTYTADSPSLSKMTNPKGGHCTTLVGWVGGKFIGENSWGTDFGSDGFYFIEPELIASNICTDFWVMQTSTDIFWEK